MPDESQSKGEQTRSEIIQAAQVLFIEQGYHGTSMRQIAQKAGLAVGGLYNHFASKEDVFREVFLEYHPYRDVIPVVAAASGDTIEQFARSILLGMSVALQKRPGFMNLMFIELVEFRSAHVQELFGEIQPQLNRIVERVVQSHQGELRPLHPLMLIRIFLGMFFAYYLTEAIFSAQAPAEFSQNGMDAFLDVWLHGVLSAGLPPEVDGGDIYPMEALR
jgi:AcrR family transcriptional regulator